MANNHRSLQAQLKTAQAVTQPNFLIELAKPTVTTPKNRTG
jgi:hypothetical protein